MSHLSRKGWSRIALAAIGWATAIGPDGARAQGVEALAPRFLSPLPPGSVAPPIPSPLRTGYEGPLVLRLPASARLLGMANAGAASNDADVIFYNPGMLGQARGVSLSVQRYGSRATASSLASVQTLGAYAIGIGVQLLQFESNALYWTDDAKRGAARLSDGGSEASSSTAVTFGVGRTIKGFRLGAAAKFAEERIGYDHDGVWALDLGLHKALGPAIVAVSVQNIGAGLDLDIAGGPLPTRLTVGFGSALVPLWERFDIGMQSAISVERDGFVRPAGGVEFGYAPIEGVSLIVRSGLRLPREPDEPLATAGLGVRVDRFSLDYAMEPTRGGRPVSHRVGFRIN